jgi:hypothetical protein
VIHEHNIQIIEPETVTHAKKQAAKQRQLERRGIAREMLPQIVMCAYDVEKVEQNLELALKYADALLAATKVDE